MDDDSLWELDLDGKSRFVGNEHACLHPDALVLTGVGWKPMHRMEVGDGVYTLHGRFRPVTWVSSHRFTGELIRIRASGMDPVTLATATHLFRNWFDGSPQWVPSGDLDAGDLLMTPAMYLGRANPFPMEGTRQVRHEGRLHLLREIEELEAVPYDGLVWNLLVDGCPTFQASVGMSHNTEQPVEFWG